MCRVQSTQVQQPFSNSGPPNGSLTGTTALPAVPSLHTVEAENILQELKG